MSARDPNESVATGGFFNVIDSAALAEVQTVCNPPGLFADNFEAEPAVDTEAQCHGVNP